MQTMPTTGISLSLSLSPLSLLSLSFLSLSLLSLSPLSLSLSTHKGPLKEFKEQKLKTKVEKNSFLIKNEVQYLLGQKDMTAGNIMTNKHTNKT